MNKDDFVKEFRVISEFFLPIIFYSDVNASIMSEISNFIDEPILNSSIIPTYLISKEIKNIALYFRGRCR